MSAESPQRSRTPSGYVCGPCPDSLPTAVSPQPVSDKSFMDSVAGFINEVVPAAYAAPIDPKEQVQWARFEYSDVIDPSFYGNADCDSTTPAPLLLILGYGVGVQVWSIPANGEATEVLSWRQSNVKVLRVLPTPSSEGCAAKVDRFAKQRPLIALVDNIPPGPLFCTVAFLSLKTGSQEKTIKFKNPVLDVFANRNSVVVTFSERIAVFDAHTLEDRCTVTTCYLSPGLCPNPVALGARWLAYAEKSLVSAWKSNGGCEGEGVSSYTATMIHAAKSLGKGLRELGESVASSLTGTTPPHHHHHAGSLAHDSSQAGIVTILDIENCVNQESKGSKTFPVESILAHFTAHNEPIVAMSFDPSGLLLLTADKRGHDFHLFRLHPHPLGSALAAVHHLYVLHRGDTTAKVQDIAFSWDSRWVAVSTLRGTTHVFPVTPYGGAIGVRTHSTPHVVNRLSRFHRSAGLSADAGGGGRSNSPISSSFEIPPAVPYPNPRLPPFPHPTVVYPLAQIRQPVQFGPGNISLQANIRSSTSRQRLSSTSEDVPNLKLCAAFARPRAWLLEQREQPRLRNQQRGSVDSLFIVACHGSLIQYDLDPRHMTGIPKEKVCDDSSIELSVDAKARWTLLRRSDTIDVSPPLSADNPLMSFLRKQSVRGHTKSEDEDRWLSQVEIVTHAGPHRRLWMGPQFIFKTYNTNNRVPMSTVGEMDAMEVGVGLGSRPARSNPVNMPLGGVGPRSSVPIYIESTSASSCEQSPRLHEMHRNRRRDSDSSTGAGELQLKEDLADAMLESPGHPSRESGLGRVIVSLKPTVAKVVNPLGTVITLPSDEESDPASPPAADSESFIQENCDETLFRPIVGVSREVFAGKITPSDATVRGNIKCNETVAATPFSGRRVPSSPPSTMTMADRVSNASSHAEEAKSKMSADADAKTKKKTTKTLKKCVEKVEDVENVETESSFVTKKTVVLEKKSDSKVWDTRRSYDNRENNTDDPISIDYRESDKCVKKTNKDVDFPSLCIDSKFSVDVKPAKNQFDLKPSKESTKSKSIPAKDSDFPTLKRKSKERELKPVEPKDSSSSVSKIKGTVPSRKNRQQKSFASLLSESNEPKESPTIEPNVSKPVKSYSAAIGNAEETVAEGWSDVGKQSTDVTETYEPAPVLPRLNAYVETKKPEFDWLDYKSKPEKEPPKKERSKTPDNCSDILNYLDDIILTDKYPEMYERLFEHEITYPDDVVSKNVNKNGKKSKTNKNGTKDDSKKATVTIDTINADCEAKIDRENDETDPIDSFKDPSMERSIELLEQDNEEIFLSLETEIESVPLLLKLTDDDASGGNTNSSQTESDDSSKAAAAGGAAPESHEGGDAIEPLVVDDTTQVCQTKANKKKSRKKRR